MVSNKEKWAPIISPGTLDAPQWICDYAEHHANHAFAATIDRLESVQNDSPIGSTVALGIKIALGLKNVDKFTVLFDASLARMVTHDFNPSDYLELPPATMLNHLEHLFVEEITKTFNARLDKALAEKQAGDVLIFNPYLLVETIMTFTEATRHPKIIVKSRASVFVAKQV